jgi:hypothetical protein
MVVEKCATLTSYSAPLPWEPSLKIATPGIIDEFYAQPISADGLGRAPARWRAAFEGKAELRAYLRQNTWKSRNGFRW